GFNDFFYDLRKQAGEFIDAEAERILENNPRIVGCGSTFQEHCASLALLRRIRQLAPDVITMMGGANCEDTLGVVTHKRFTWVDYVVSGEADLLLPGLCRDIFEKGRDIQLEDLAPGVMAPAHRKEGGDLYKNLKRAVVENLDQSPVPDFDDYFETFEASGIKDYIHPAVVFESSRGCWWGEKNQCTFCGLNGKGIAYRSKSARRVISDVETLTQKYGLNNFLAVDCILNLDYFKTVFPYFRSTGKKYPIVYETKTDLNREQVKLLADTGISCIQPGIESFHNEILKRLNKGNMTWTNIQLLKWTREFGIDTIWLALYLLPDEIDDWYCEMAELLPKIFHLQPPMVSNEILYTRFSRYFNNPQKYNITLEPIPGYSYVYPLSPDDIDQFAYFFENTNRQSIREDADKRKGLLSFLECLGTWNAGWGPFKRGEADHPPLLQMEETEEGLTILDTRSCAVEKHIVLSGLAVKVYKTCDTASTRKRLLSKLEQQGRPNCSWRDIESILEQLQRKKILVK
ncbi:MAG: RiPP maturation radical SAM protein 1, partial [bacterium]|nr:RiPP maturation radical SAM protein 1 [bacterium]